MAGKAKTRGEQKRAKRGRPAKEGVPREANGRASRIPVERREAARRVVLEARCKLMGWAVNRDTLADAAAPHLGCNAGRAIHGHPGRAGLWDTIQHIRGVYARHAALLGLPMPYPTVAALMAMPEPVGTDGVEVDSRYDDRPLEERVRSSSAALMRLEGVLMRARAVTEVKAAVLRDEPVTDRAKLVAALLTVEADLAGGTQA